MSQPIAKNDWFFLLEEKIYFSFSRYLDFSVSSESTNFKVCNIIIGITNDYSRFIGKTIAAGSAMIEARSAPFQAAGGF